MSKITLCLPKDKNMKLVSDILREINFPINNYPPNNRSYRPEVFLGSSTSIGGSTSGGSSTSGGRSISGESIRAKIFAEKDIVIQVAIGNYSFGFCGLDWIEEFRIKFPLSGVKIIRKLGETSKRIYACSHIESEKTSIHDFKDLNQVRIISEYHNLAEHFAIENRLKGYKIFSAWGSVEAYLPDYGEIVLIPAKDEDDVRKRDLYPLELILDARLCIIVNQKDYETKDLSSMLNYLNKIKGNSSDPP